jgi:hypothetical protein
MCFMSYESRDVSFLSSLLPRKEASRQSSSLNAWSDHYGAISLACDYAGYPQTDDFFVAFWQHGCFGPWETRLRGRILYNNEDRFRDWRLFVARKDEEQILREQGFTRVRAIGLPFVYVRERRADRVKKSLLIMPTHSLSGFSIIDRAPFLAYVTEIVAYRKQFDQVVACVHPSCAENGFWIDEFRAFGIPIIPGVGHGEKGALKRLRRILDTFEFVTTNGWGSHVAYALASGARVSIFGTVPSFSAENYVRCDVTWQKHAERLAECSSHAIESEKRSFLAELFVPPNEAKENRELGKWLVGEDNQISPPEMRNVLRHAFGHTLRHRMKNAFLRFVLGREKN